MSAPDALRQGERSGGPTLIIGGAGFIGCNLADRIARDGGQVLVLDNLSRPGVERNAEWLRRRHPERVALTLGDIRDPDAVRAAIGRAGRVFHLAGQVAVTTSLVLPLEDFAINAAGTLNVLEALRARRDPPPLVFTSTNKVYGHLEDLEVEPGPVGYRPLDAAARTYGVSEERRLAFCSPYGCSKGAADQYVLDYARTFGLPATVLRMSCIYGPRQFGTEDQGWVAHFARRVIDGAPITIYGDGLQVRDVLYVDDLVEALLLACRQIGRTRAQAFNMGGGPANAVCLLRVLDLIERRLERRPRVDFGPWRPADQRFYVSDTRRFERLTGWRATTRVETGIARLVDWLRSSVGFAEQAEDVAA